MQTDCDNEPCPPPASSRWAVGEQAHPSYAESVFGRQADPRLALGEPLPASTRDTMLFARQTDRQEGSVPCGCFCWKCRVLSLSHAGRFHSHAGVGSQEMQHLLDAMIEQNSLPS